MPSDDRRSRIVLVSLLELERRERARAIELVSVSIGPDETPVFVTDDLDIREIAMNHHLYEYLPPLEDQARIATPSEWEIYLATRLKLILHKWNPTRIISAGTPLEHFVKSAGKRQL